VTLETISARIRNVEERSEGNGVTERADHQRSAPVPVDVRVFRCLSCGHEELETRGATVAKPFTLHAIDEQQPKTKLPFWR
jgi:hypothetical protein